MSKIDLKYGLNKVGLPLIVTSNNPNLCFLIDTGATHNVIFSFVVKALRDNITITGEGAKISGIDGSEHDTKTLSISLQIEDKEIPVDFNMMEATEIVRKVQEESGVQIHGILGVPFLDEHKCVLDFDTQTFQYD